MEPANSRPLERALAQAWAPDQWRDVTVLAAVSGGPDSVALLRVTAALKKAAGGMGRLIVAHFNHQLRPDADEDAAFVAALANRLELSFEVGDANVAELAAGHGDGIESAARDARYRFLQQTAERHGARYVATGHTADDQVETVLFNLLRGTGLSGLAGIPRARALGPAASLIRPLLNVRRVDVLAYLNEIGQPFRTDPSNACRDFARNRIRTELLPLLRNEFNPDIENAITRLSHLAADAQRLIEGLADNLLDRALSQGVSTPGHAKQVLLNIQPLAGCDRHLVREMFIALWRQLGWPQQNMGFAEWDLLAELATGDANNAPLHSSKRMFPGGIIVERQESTLSLTPTPTV